VDGGGGGPSAEGGAGDATAPKEAGSDGGSFTGPTLPIGGDPGPLTVRVTDPSSGAVSGASVVFEDVDGTRTIATTNTNGEATQVVQPGAKVTIAVQSPGSLALTSFGYVDVPAVIQVGGPRVGFAAGVGYDLSVSAYAGAASYLADWGCGETALPTPDTPAAGNISTLCLDGSGAAHVLVTALDASSQPLAFGHATAVPSGGHVSVSIGNWSAASAPASVAVTNTPADVASATVQISYVDGPLAYFGGTGPAPFSFVTPPSSAAPDLLADVVFAYDAASRTGRIVRQPVGAGNLTFGAETFLPSLTAPQVTAGPTPTLSFTAGGDLGVATGIVARVQAAKDAVPMSWTFVFPPAPSFTPPTLPPELAAFAPTAPWTVQFVTALESPTWHYRTLQADAMSLWRGVRNLDATTIGPGGSGGPGAMVVRYATSEP
jgi:hypothetical protein